MIYINCNSVDSRWQ